MRAVIYCRISRESRDPDAERGLGVDRQERDCRDLAERLGYEVVDTYLENDVSASSLSRKPRPRFEAMLAAVRQGTVDVVLAYSNSRLTRRLRELEDLINLHEQTGVKFVTVVSGTDDLSTADGRMIARIKASVDAGEAERTGERLRRQKADRAARGLPQGGRYRVYGYGWQDEIVDGEGEPRTRVRDRWLVNAVEAETVRDIFSRRASGQSATFIARHLNERGLTTAAGKPWTQSSVAKLISRPGYCGLREHNGQIVGKTSYPAIVDEVLWRQANGEAARSSPGTNTRRWLLTNIAICGKCLHGMAGNAARNGYRCNLVHGGCGGISIRADWLEDPVLSWSSPERPLPRERQGRSLRLHPNRWTLRPLTPRSRL